MEITNHNNNKYSFSLSSNSGFLFLKALTLWLMKRSSVIAEPQANFWPLQAKPTQAFLAQQVASMKMLAQRARRGRTQEQGRGHLGRTVGGPKKKELHGCASAMNSLQVLGRSLSGVRVELASGLVRLYRHGCIVFARSQHSAYHPVLSFLEKWRNTTERDSIRFQVQIQKSSS